ncbi:MAG: ATP-binding cassette domain-containing protein, partial [Alphaproteobacteria bacterium]
MPQSLAIDETLPLTAARFLRLGGRADPGRLKAGLADVGAAHLAGTQMADLSGGELRRVLLARALLRKPHLLVLDEPVQGVDITGQSDLYGLIDAMRRRLGCGVLMVSHDLHVVMGATDRVVCLNHHVCCTGHPEAVSRHPEYQALFGPAAAARFAVYTHGHDHRHDDHGEVVPLVSSAEKNEDTAEMGPDATPEGGRRHG